VLHPREKIREIRVQKNGALPATNTANTKSDTEEVGRATLKENP